MIHQAHIYIKGDVIGIGFRAWTKIQTKMQGGIKGWVRNNFEKTELLGTEGGVEILIQGSEADLDQMINILKKGPPVARIDEVDVFWQKVTTTFETFEIRK